MRTEQIKCEDRADHNNVREGWIREKGSSRRKTAKKQDRRHVRARQKAEHGLAKHDRAEQDMTGHGVTGQSNSRKGRAGQDC